MNNPRNLDEIATEAWSFSLDQVVINSASWSPDGTLLVLDCRPDFLVVLNGNTGEEVRRLEGLTYSHSHSFWSEDGSLLFSHVHDEIRVWDIETWREIRRIEVPWADSLDVDPHGSIFATYVSSIHRSMGQKGKRRVDLRRTTDGSNVASIETKNSVDGVSLSSSRQLATWSNGSSVSIWDIDEGYVVQTLKIRKGMPNRMIWSPSESLIVVATNSAEIYIFDAVSGKQLFYRDSHCEKGCASDGIYAMGFSSDETWFASKDMEGKVLVWGTTDWLPFAVFQSNTLNWRLREPPLLAIKPNESTILTQDWDCTGLTVWHLRDWLDETPTMSATRGEPSRVSVMPNASSEEEDRPHGPFVISLCELERLGSFTRWQEIRERLQHSEQEHGPLYNYPLFPGWSEPDSDIDVFDGSSWKRVRFRSWDGKRIIYEHEGEVKQLDFHQNTVAPAGHFTSFHENEFTISSAELLAGTMLPGGTSIVISSKLVHVEWPYVTLYVKRVPQNAVGESSYSKGSYLFHIADPRLTINGETRSPSRFNSPIAVSHRWLGEDHPDESGAQYRELLDRAARMKLHPMQPFLIDYCSLPQKPWTAIEQEIFAREILPFHTAFSSSSIIIKYGWEDYGTRAWCMLELILIAVEGWLADGPEKLRKPPELPPSLGKTWAEAENYLKLSNENIKNLAGAISDSPRYYIYTYLSDNRNIAFHQAMKKQQRRLLDLFDGELDVRDESDRPRIKKILRELVFRGFHRE